MIPRWARSPMKTVLRNRGKSSGTKACARERIRVPVSEETISAVSSPVLWSKQFLHNFESEGSSAGGRSLVQAGSSLARSPPVVTGLRPRQGHLPLLL